MDERTERKVRSIQRQVQLLQRSLEDTFPDNTFTSITFRGTGSILIRASDFDNLGNESPYLDVMYLDGEWRDMSNRAYYELCEFMTKKEGIKSA